MTVGKACTKGKCYNCRGMKQPHGGSRVLRFTRNDIGALNDKNQNERKQEREFVIAF